MRRYSLLLPIMLGPLPGLTPLAIDMYLPAIPSIARDLGSSVELVQLTVSTFLGGFALGQLFYGPLADSLGRKPVLLFGIGLFMLASIGCAFAPSLPWLLACRLLQALVARPVPWWSMPCCGISLAVRRWCVDADCGGADHDAGAVAGSCAGGRPADLALVGDLFHLLL